MNPIKLSTLDNTSINELNEISHKIEEYVKNESDNTLSVVVDRINSKPSIWQKFFPDKFTKTMDKMTIERIKSINNNKSQMLALHQSIQLEIARQDGDAAVASVGMKNQALIANFAKQTLESLSTTLEGSRSNEVARIERQFVEAEKYKHNEAIYGPYKESLNFELAQYFGFVQDLIVGFRTALKKKVTDIN